MVGIVIVSHSKDIAVGTAALAAQMAGEDVRIEAAGGAPGGGLGTDGALVEAAIAAADQGDGAIVLGDLGSAILTARHVLDGHTGNGAVRLVDAPLVEGAVAAAVVSSAGRPVDEVASAAEEARAIPKL
jgi:phosphoenolpyruvate---glycerone phosphotransferase subunit DhaM